MYLETCREIKFVIEAADRRNSGMELKRRKKKWLCISKECYSDPALKGIEG